MKHRNFKNLAKTLANKVQQSTIFEKCFEVNIHTGPSRLCKLCEFEHHMLISQHIEVFPDETIIKLPNWIKFGFHYRKDFFVCTGKMPNSNLPLFEQIKTIVLISENIFFITIKWKTCEFCTELNAYKMTMSNNSFNIIDLKLLVYKEPYNLHFTHSGSQFYLVPKHTFVF